MVADEVEVEAGCVVEDVAGVEKVWLKPAATDRRTLRRLR
jgi:hypothetical protein